MAKTLKYNPVMSDQIMGIELSRVITGFLHDRYEHVDLQEVNVQLSDGLEGFLEGLITQNVEGAKDLLCTLRKYGSLRIQEA